MLVIITYSSEHNKRKQMFENQYNIKPIYHLFPLYSIPNIAPIYRINEWCRAKKISI